MKSLPWLIVLLAALGYVGWPYYALYKIDHALEIQDSATLDRLVNWDTLRVSIRDELAAQAQPSAAEDAAAGGTGLASIVAPAVTDLLVEAYASPQGLARLISEGRVSLAPAAGSADAAPTVGAASAAQAPAPDVPSWSEAFTSLDGFLAKLASVARPAVRAVEDLLGDTYRAARRDYDFMFFTDPFAFEARQRLSSPAQTAPLVLVLRLDRLDWRLVELRLPRTRAATE